MTNPARGAAVWTEVRYDLDRGVATVTLNRPSELNRWTARMAEELSEALARADADDEVGAVVLTGAGRAFCAGLDLSAAPSFEADDRPEPSLLPWHLSKPVVAAINGHAIGVGATLALTADVRVVAESAKVQFPFVRLGLISELGSHAALTRLVGQEAAADLLLSGRMVLGTEAHSMGFASRCLPAGDVLAAATAWAADVAGSTSREAVAISKRLLHADLLEAVGRIAPEEVAALGRLAVSPATQARLSALSPR